MRRIVLIVFGALLIIGCNSDKKKELVPLDQVPEAVMKAANERLPDVKFDRAFREPNGDYELIGKDKKGRTRELDISPTGQITQEE